MISTEASGRSAPARAPVDPAEQFLSALLRQLFYDVGSERQLMEQLNYSLLYRWFVRL